MCWLIALAIVIAAFLFRFDVERDLSRLTIAQHDGNRYYISIADILPSYLQLSGDTEGFPRQSEVSLFFDGKPLGPPHSLHEDIRLKGRGAYSHYKTALFFSSPDGSDPTTSPERYSIRAPIRLNGTVLFFLGLLGAVSAAQIVRRLQVNPRLNLATKIGALGLIGIIAPWFWIGDILPAAKTQWLAGNISLSVVYLLVLALNLASLFVVPFLSSALLRVILSVVAALSIFADLTARHVSGAPLRSNLIEILWSERTMALGAFETYRGAILKCLFAATLILIAFAQPPKRAALARRYVALPLLAILSCTGLSLMHLDLMLYTPPIFSIAPQFAIAAVPQTRAGIQREPVAYNRRFTPQTDKLVVVIDESVRGDVLSINDARFDDLPSLTASDPRVANFGLAISATNCSVATRIILRAGLQKEQLPDINGLWQRRPLIWDYAKAAGYRTVLLDTFSPDGEFHSYMTASEAKEIDTIRTFLGDPAYDRDKKIAEALKDELNKPGRAFIYVNKHGVHPPYDWRLPPDYIYEPKGVDVFEGHGGAHEKAIRTYLRALKYNVDGFFASILPAMQGNQLLFYTSDHGQSLYEGGHEISHCSGQDLPRGEVIVPLLTITTKTDLQPIYHDAAIHQHDKADHFQLFAALLQAMGYDGSWTSNQFGLGLLDNDIRPKRGFLLGVFNTSNSVWMDVDAIAAQSVKTVFAQTETSQGLFLVLKGTFFWRFGPLIVHWILLSIAILGTAFGAIDLFQGYRSQRKLARLERHRALGQRYR